MKCRKPVLPEQSVATPATADSEVTAEARNAGVPKVTAMAVLEVEGVVVGHASARRQPLPDAICCVALLIRVAASAAA